MPSSPSERIKVNTRMKQEPEKEKKNIFQHMSEALGTHTVNLAKGQVPLMQKVYKIIMSLVVYMALGYIIGMVADMFLKSQYSLASIFALVMLFVWIIKNGRKYL